MIIPDATSVNEHYEFGTANLGPIFQELSLLNNKYEETKKTQNNSESLMVIPRGVEPLFPG